jgi:hypothetical protein
MITIPASVGELIDKISILQIKKNKIKDESKLKKVEKELTQLTHYAHSYLSMDAIDTLYKDLVGINGQLWNVEDELRILEKQQSFGDRFVSLARSVYHLNDERFNVKNKINVLTDSDIQEVKQYIEYK